MSDWVSSYDAQVKAESVANPTTKGRSQTAGPRLGVLGRSQPQRACSAPVSLSKNAALRDPRLLPFGVHCTFPGETHYIVKMYPTRTPGEKGFVGE
ncbi:hypothetical protein Y032_0009g411 [Ancylostoma ceylanicum]|uniref:Uncharacterized protein n=1 Tax=Ancylostoma ceylanicum TaxID=53326 RepID=A0A016VIN0_9BILA|nr:hypothetical protein Y032_0009g411 [Ancylostoma ceylanicum]